MPEWIYEFLYRGFPHGGADGAWHLIVMNQIGKQTVMNMTQAEAAGWALPEILNQINVNTMQEVEALRIENQALKTEIERLTSQSNEAGEEPPPPAEEGGE